MPSPAEDLITALRGLLERPGARNGAYPTIAVDGRGAAGKTSIVEEVSIRLPGLTVIHGDDYFEPHDDPITWGAFNEARFETDVLSALRTGRRDIPVQPYRFSQGRAVPEEPLAVGQGVIVERCFSFALDVPWDLRVWVDTPADVCLRRGVERDSVGGQGDRAERAWREVWQPREDRYIAAYDPRGRADIVVPGE